MKAEGFAGRRGGKMVYVERMEGLATGEVRGGLHLQGSDGWHRGSVKTCMRGEQRVGSLWEESNRSGCICPPIGVEAKTRTPSLAGPEVRKENVSFSISLLPPSPTSFSLNGELRVRSRDGNQSGSPCPVVLVEPAETAHSDCLFVSKAIWGQ